MDDFPNPAPPPDDMHLDIVAGDVSGDDIERRRWLGIHFDCCNVYSRVYKNAQGSAYVGWCPRCARRIHIPIGLGGTDHRFFKAH